MKSLFYILIFLSFSSLFAQNCVNVGKVYSTAKFRDLNSEPTRIEIKKITENVLSSFGYCISSNGQNIEVEIFYFGNKRDDKQVVNMNSNETQVSVNLIYKSIKYSGDGVIQNDVRDVLLEFMDSKFSETNLARVIKLAISSCILNFPDKN